MKIKVTILWGVLLALALTASLALTACGGSETDKRAATGQSSDVETIQVGVLPVAVALNKYGLWVANFDDDTVSRIDPRTNAAVGKPISVGNGPVGLATTAGAVWVANMYDGTVTRIDPDSGQVTGRPIRVGDRPLALAAGEGSVWVFNSTAGTVSKIDPRTRKVVSTSPRVVARGAGNQDYAGLAVGDGFVWVPSPTKNIVVRVDTRSNRQVGAAIEVGAGRSGWRPETARSGSPISTVARSRGSTRGPPHRPRRSRSVASPSRSQPEPASPGS